jgi:hypothetical protein
MHLAGESNARDRISATAQLAESAPHCLAARPPPIARILFRPSLLRARERSVVAGSGRNYFSAFVDNESSGAAGANIDP